MWLPHYLLESPCTGICQTPKDHTNSSPAIRASYSTLLFVASKLKRRAYSISIPLGPQISNPAPGPFLFFAPSTYIVRSGIGSGRFSLGPLTRCGGLDVHSIMKSVRAWALMLARGS
ncbi:hypothetical protein LIER_04968 [Lithospermum erythrorhizon]|uniref:Uncharacterized protein n=1 Tax=Lithospermum erythrorhizon TaxID=34254 RepID=A0AAV3NZY1_LITER